MTGWLDFHHLGAWLGALALMLVASSALEVVPARKLLAAEATGPKVIYVADFELEVADITSESRRAKLAPMERLRSGGPLAQRQDPRSEARHLIDLMATSIVQDLDQAGFGAHRLPAGVSLPSGGWLVRGVFLEVDEGNRLRRAVIGFGQGQTEMQVAAAVDDLSKAPPPPLYDIDTSAHSGNMPGAAVTLNPIVAGIRFAMAGHDLERNVRDCAAKIAAAVETHMAAR